MERLHPMMKYGNFIEVYNNIHICGIIMMTWAWWIPGHIGLKCISYGSWLLILRTCIAIRAISASPLGIEGGGGYLIFDLLGVWYLIIDFVLILGLISYIWFLSQISDANARYLMFDFFEGLIFDFVGGLISDRVPPPPPHRVRFLLTWRT